MIILDKVWMVVSPNNSGVVYEVGNSAPEVWKKIIDSEIMGTGHTKRTLNRLGYRAKKVNIMITG